MHKSIGQHLRNYFITGAVLILPLWVTILLIRALMNLVKDAFAWLPPAVHPARFVPVYGIELVIALGVILLVGLTANNIMGKKIIHTGERALNKIPVIKTLYSGIKQLAKGLLSDKSAFSRVVGVQFPIQGLWFIAFVTGEEAVSPVHESGKMYKLFIPTTPNPTSGFFCYAGEETVRPLDLTVDEAFKLIISAGFDSPEGSIVSTPVSFPDQHKK
jgi:uncharacterized membrane protein